MKYETKENHSRRGNCLLNITYYKLRAGKYFAHYIIGQSVESYRVGGAEEFLNQILMIPGAYHVWKTMRKKPKIMARAGLCSGQRHGNTMMNAMKGDLPDMVRDVMQANHQNSASSINESCRVLCS